MKNIKPNLSGAKQLLDVYLEQGKLPGYTLLVSQNGEEAGFIANGKMDIERGKVVQRDTIFRIYSMTKPITSVAMMQLWEKGLFELDDPVYKYIPSWKDLKVFDSGTAENYTVKKPERHMTIKDLLTHTAGLAYGFNPDHPVDQLYHAHGMYLPSHDSTLEEGAEKLSRLPLCFSPGTSWIYSLATDVIGYLVEIISGERLDDYFKENILQPLEMKDTDFFVQSDQAHRLAACYQLNPETKNFELQDDPKTSVYLTKPELRSGGGGLLSTIDDYHVFSKAMLGKGEYKSTKILKPETVELMTRNHLPENNDLATMGQSKFCETTMQGTGFGLGYSVLLDPNKAGSKTSKGEFAWGGMASTYHWVDPAQGIVAVLMTQLIPSDVYPIRPELKNVLCQ